MRAFLKTSLPRRGVLAPSLLVVLAMAAPMSAPVQARVPSPEHSSIEHRRVPANVPAATPPMRPIFSSNVQDIYRITFVGGEPAIVDLRGSGATNLDLFVYAENGSIVCSSRHSSDRETCEWLPALTSAFLIEVRNLGSTANSYELWTN